MTDERTTSLRGDFEQFSSSPKRNLYLDLEISPLSSLVPLYRLLLVVVVVVVVKYSRVRSAVLRFRRDAARRRANDVFLLARTTAWRSSLLPLPAL